MWGRRRERVYLECTHDIFALNYALKHAHTKEPKSRTSRYCPRGEFAGEFADSEIPGTGSGAIMKNNYTSRVRHTTPTWNYGNAHTRSYFGLKLVEHLFEAGGSFRYIETKHVVWLSLFKSVSRRHTSAAAATAAVAAATTAVFSTYAAEKLASPARMCSSPTRRGSSRVSPIGVLSSVR